jgi:hypothetical protein
MLVQCQAAQSVEADLLRFVLSSSAPNVIAFAKLVVKAAAVRRVAHNDHSLLASIALLTVALESTFAQQSKPVRVLVWDEQQPEQAAFCLRERKVGSLSTAET